MPSFDVTGVAYYTVKDNEDSPWTLRVEADYRVAFPDSAPLPGSEALHDDLCNGSLKHVHLYRQFAEDGPWEAVAFDFIGPQHWDNVNEKVWGECEEEAYAQAVVCYDDWRDKVLGLDK